MAHDASVQSIGGHCLPDEIWQASQSIGQDSSPDVPTYCIETLATDIYNAAVEGLDLTLSEKHLSLEGTNGILSLVDAFEEALKKAVSLGDYTSVLLPHRTFTM